MNDARKQQTTKTVILTQATRTVGYWERQDASRTRWFRLHPRGVRTAVSASATIEVTEGQKAISTGPYALVRHPMYSGTILLTLATPVALGSWWALLVVPIQLPVLIWRIADEEKFLKSDLEGYAQYCDKVKYRLIPGLY